jgi:hypothetical protein
VILPPRPHPLTMASNIKFIQGTFGYPAYPGKANVKNAPPAYYRLREQVKSWVHYNGLFTTTIIEQSGSWDALVARIMADQNFPQPAAGVAPPFPRSSSPSTWNGNHCRSMCNFIRELCKVSDIEMIYPHMVTNTQFVIAELG